MELKINTPEGYSFAGVSQMEDGEIIVTFSEKTDAPPKSWEEYCDKFPIEDDETYIDGSSSIESARFDGNTKRDERLDMNVLPDEASAKAVLALCRIVQLVKCYNRGWVPDWSDKEYKHVIRIGAESVYVEATQDEPAVMAFKTGELRDMFAECFMDLILETAPLCHCDGLAG